VELAHRALGLIGRSEKDQQAAGPALLHTRVERNPEEQVRSGRLRAGAAGENGKYQESSISARE